MHGKRCVHAFGDPAAEFLVRYNTSQPELPWLHGLKILLKLLSVEEYVIRFRLTQQIWTITSADWTTTATFLFFISPAAKCILLQKSRLASPRLAPPLSLHLKLLYL